MQIKSLFSVLSAISLTSTATTASLPSRRGDPVSLHWQVSDFETGCSPKGCTYSFNITGLGTPNTPSFNTTCSGTDLKLDYQPCQFPSISSTVAPLSDGSGGWNVTAQHFWLTQDGEDFWAIGQTNIANGTKQFEVTVKDQYGAA